MMGDQDDPYIRLLQQVFMNCDPRGDGLLGHEQLRELCHQLQLDADQTCYIIDQLVGQDFLVKVDFDEFKEVFVSLLTLDPRLTESEKERKMSPPRSPKKLIESEDINSAREYLKSTLAKLGLSEDGYLRVSDLGFVCSDIGMNDVTEETIEQLFSTLDQNGDGKVSFEELLRGMSTQQELLLNPSTSHRVASLPRSPQDHSFSSSVNFFYSLDTRGDGLVDTDTITGLWESFGFSDTKALLEDLGITGSRINVHNLSDILEEELFSVSSQSSRTLCQVALITLRNEVKQLKKMVEQLTEERVQMKKSVSEANSRADLLAQEVDDHHRQLERSSKEKLLSLEKKYRERVNGLEQDLVKEKELFSLQCLHVESKLEKEHLRHQESESRLQESITQLEKEKNKIAGDLRTWIEKCCQLETKNSELLKKVDESLSMKRRLEDGENMKSEEHLERLRQELESARTQSKNIQDLNDELLLELEQLKKEQKSASGHRFRRVDVTADIKKKQKIDSSEKGRRRNRRKRPPSSSDPGPDSDPAIQTSHLIPQPQNDRLDPIFKTREIGDSLDQRTSMELQKLATCTKFLNYLVQDLEPDFWPHLQLLSLQLLHQSSLNSASLLTFILEHLVKVRCKNATGFYMKSNSTGHIAVLGKNDAVGIDQRVTGQVNGY